MISLLALCDLLLVSFRFGLDQLPFVLPFGSCYIALGSLSLPFGVLWLPLGSLSFVLGSVLSTKATGCPGCSFIFVENKTKIYGGIRIHIVLIYLENP